MQMADCGFQCGAERAHSKTWRRIERLLTFGGGGWEDVFDALSACAERPPYPFAIDHWAPLTMRARQGVVRMLVRAW